MKATESYGHYAARYGALAQAGEEQALELLRDRIDALMWTDEKANQGIARAFADAGLEGEYAGLVCLRGSLAPAGCLEGLLATAPAQPRFGELIYFALAQGLDFGPFVCRVDEDELSGYFMRMMQHEDFGDRVQEYYLAAPPAETAHTLQWECALVERALINRDTRQAGTKQLFQRYCRSLGAYVRHIYSPEILEDEEITVLPRVYRFGYLAAQGLALLDGGETPEGLRLLLQAGETYPVMLAHVQQLVEDTRDVLEQALQRQRAAREERELVAAQVKEQIRLLADQGDVASAEQALLSYAQVNPEDEEIPSLRLQLRLAGYRS